MTPCKYMYIVFLHDFIVKIVKPIYKEKELNCVSDGKSFKCTMTVKARYQSQMINVQVFLVFRGKKTGTIIMKGVACPSPRFIYRKMHTLTVINTIQMIITFTLTSGQSTI